MNRLTETLSGFSNRKSVEIMSLIDEAGHTLLHSAAYYNTFKIAEYIINFFKRKLMALLMQRHLNKYKLASDSEVP